MADYCTLDDVKSRLNISGSENDTLIENIIDSASRIIDKYCGRSFTSVTEVRYFDGNGGRVLLLNDDLLSIEPPESRACVELTASGTITVADGKAQCTMPFAGEIEDIQGYIETLGTGAGTSTDIQISNGATDYLTTVGAFEVDSATNLLEGQVLASNPAFEIDDIIELDVDAVSTNPADIHIWVWVKVSSLAEAVIINDDETLDSTDYILYPLNSSPKRWIELDENEGKIWAKGRKKISIAGKWGYCEDTDLPGAIWNACVELSCRIFKMKDTAYQDFTASAELGQLFYSKALSPSIQLVLDLYKVKEMVLGV